MNKDKNGKRKRQAKFGSWVRKDKRRAAVVAGSITGGMALVLVNLLYLSGMPGVSQLLNLTGAMLAVAPSVFIRYNDFRTAKKVESRFPQFVRSLVESVRSGMTLPQAIKLSAKHDYGLMNPYVKRMAAQIDWGIPFDAVLMEFGERSGSPLLKRTVSTVIETHRSGGNISDVLQAVSESVMEVTRIKKERASHIYSQMITGYTIFFVFLGVMIGMQKFLLPSLSFGTGGTTIEGLPVAQTVNIATAYESMFLWMIIIQGAFAGIAIGKMAEGAVLAGLKHSIALVSIGYAAWTLAGIFI